MKFIKYKFIYMSKRTKKNIHNQVMIPKVTSQKRKDTTKNSKDFINALLNKNSSKQTIMGKQPVMGKQTVIGSRQPVMDKQPLLGRQDIIGKSNTKNKISNNKNSGKIIENFHKAIKLTNSDEIILKMLDLKEKDIVNFYKNLEKMIGKDLSHKIRQDIPKQLVTNTTIVNKNGVSLSLCPFCQENKSNCVILLCGHLICNICAKNINRCKFPCPRCKKPIKYIQFISN